MEIWLDTLDTEAIKKAKQMGILHGVTTNPSILAQEGCGIKKALEKIQKFHQGPVTFQVVGETVQEMVDQGTELHKLSPHIIVKIPVTSNGLEAIKILTSLGIPTMATVVLDIYQALLAGLVGATYIAPYVSRMESQGYNANDILNQIVQIFKNQNLKTKILAASIKDKGWIPHLASIGISAVTLKPPVFYDLVATTEYTEKAIKQFALEWHESYNTFLL